MKNNKNATMKEQEKKADNVMQELDDETMDQVSGAGNPFANAARVPTQEITKDMRNRV